MTRSDVICKLRQEGFAATAGRVRQALENGYISPKPQKGPRGAYDFQPEHIRQLRAYLVRVKPGPRSREGVTLRVCGPNDRLRRLEREKVVQAERRSRRLAMQQRQKDAEAVISWLEGLVKSTAIEADSKGKA